MEDIQQDFSSPSAPMMPSQAAMGGMSAEPTAQKMLSQDEVNKIVAREKSRAAESARREADEKYRRELEQLNELRLQQQQHNSTVSREVDTNAIYQELQERWNKEMEERQMRQQMTQVANNYVQKIEEAKKSYEDFDTVTADFDPTAFPQLTYLLSGIPDAGHALYDLSKNPLKLAALDRLAEKNPKQAQTELLKLAQSISQNRQALENAQTQNVAEPLDRLNASRIAGSNGKMTIRDLRNQPWLRG